MESNQVLTLLEQLNMGVTLDKDKPPDKRLSIRYNAHSKLEIRSYVCVLSCTLSLKNSSFSGA